MQFLIILNLSITLMMLGIIWFVQLIHYPLFSYADLENFKVFHSQHTRRITLLVAPLMISEAFIASLVLITMPTLTSFLGISILVFIWACTFFIQVPIHNKLNNQFDSKLFHHLLKSNWFRTIGWSIRTVSCFLLI